MKQHFIRIFMTFFLSLASWNLAWAQPIELVTPNVPGGAVDMTARAMSKALTNAGIENIVTYHPGANGDIALRHVLQKQNNIVLVASKATFVFSNVTAKRDNIFTKNMTLLGPTVTNAMVFITTNQTLTIQDLVKKALKEPVHCGVSNAHGEIELKSINKRFNTKFEPILYKGTGQLIPDVVGGHVLCAYDQIAPYAGMRSRVRFLAASRAWDNVPAISDVLPNYSYETWFGAAIPNNSNLLSNNKVLTIISNWSQDQELAKLMTDRTFEVSPADPKLNHRAEQETKQYFKLLN
jgi:tripartite-type tricarboxylate transporter receptor subunit TctC